MGRDLQHGRILGRASRTSEPCFIAISFPCFCSTRRHIVEVDVFPIEDRAGLSPRALTSLRSAVATQNTLQSAVRWALARGYRLLDVIDQDEFTRDVVFEMEPEQYLVYDAT